MPSAALERHPATPCAALRGIDATMTRNADGSLAGRATGSKATSIACASRRRARRAPARRLWQHTCCELFIARRGRPGLPRVQLLALGRVGGVSLSRATAKAALVGKRRIRGSRRSAAQERLDLQRVSSSPARRKAAHRPVGGDRGERRRALVLGAAASRRASRTSIIPTRSPWSSMKFGIDRLLEEPALRKPLAGPARRAARASGVGHARISRIRSMRSPAPAMRAHRGVRPAARPARRQAGQHGRVAGLHRSGARHPGVQPVRRGAPADAAMMDSFDVLLVDLQDLGCRIYTFITTLRYVLEAAAEHGKSVWVLDRPNPAGRPVEGLQAARRLGKLRRRRAAADAPRPHARRAGALVRAHACSSTSTARSSRWRAGSRPRAGLRLAARRARLGEPEPERAEPVDGALLSPAR